MSVRRDKRNGHWFFRKMVRLPDGRRERLFGVPTTCGLPDTKLGAEEAERLAIARVLSTGEVKPTPPEPKKEVPTVREFSATFLEHARLTNKAATYRAKEIAVRVYINAQLGDLRLDAVTYAVVSDFTLRLASAPRGLMCRTASRRHMDQPLHPKTTNNVLKILHRLLSVAKKRQLLTALPEFEFLKLPPSTFRFFSLDELDRIIEAAPPNWRPMIKVASRTGLRIGELIGLRWEDVYLDSQVLVVRQSVVKGVLTTPKSGKPREVPISDETAQLLRRTKHDRGPFVFADAKGHFINHSTADYALRAACRAAGLKPAGWHTLRHSFASNLVQAETNMKAIQEMLGHATMQETQRYAHLRTHHLRSAVEKLDRGHLAASWQQPKNVDVTSVN